MTLKEFIKKLNSFNCEVLRDKEIAHCFIDKLGYSYKLKVEDVVFDAEKGLFMILGDNLEKYLWSEKAIIKSNSVVSK